MSTGLSSPESVAARLKNQAKELGESFNRVLLLYFQERFLARLAKSPHQKKLILKGGLYLYSIYGMTTRPTQDIDFLGVGSPEAELEAIFKEIIAIELDDSVVFAADSLKSKTILAGVNLNLIAYLGKSKNVLKFDIGFSDAVTPEPQTIHYPSFLSKEDIIIYGYTNETVIAEKLEATTSLYLGNSRLKDIYDLYQFTQGDDVDRNVLQEAIRNTFQQRNTDLAEIQKLFEATFFEDDIMVRQWGVYWKKTERTAVPKLSEVMESIKHLVVTNQ